MGEILRKFFVCDNCNNKSFKLVYSFSLDFHPVNFSEDLIYDKITEKHYRCTKCGKVFTKQEIENSLTDIKKRFRNKNNELLQ